MQIDRINTEKEVKKHGINTAGIPSVFWNLNIFDAWFLV